MSPSTIKAIEVERDMDPCLRRDDGERETNHSCKGLARTGVMGGKEKFQAALATVIDPAP
jgi:hypothetical protein